MMERVSGKAAKEEAKKTILMSNRGSGVQTHIEEACADENGAIWRQVYETDEWMDARQIRQRLYRRKS